jgi:glutathione S-transferase
MPLATAGGLEYEFGGKNYLRRRRRTMPTKLYEFPMSPFVRKVKVVLAEKKVPFESVPINGLKGENMTPDFLRLNPFHKVPVLQDEEVTLYESTAINEYLEEKYPTPNLLPKDRANRARARMLEEVFDNYFFPPVMAMFSEKFFTPKERFNPKVIEENLAKTNENLSFLNRELEGKNYLAGEFSVADIGYAVILPTLQALFGVDLSPYPNVGKWLERVTSRPSYKAAEPPPEAIQEFLKAVGA